MRRLACVVALVTVLSAVASLSAQQTSPSTVPSLISYSGKLVQPGSATISSKVTGVTFAIYKQQEGGAPVWMETQNVTLDAGGHYSVLLGGTRAEGLPPDLFSAQEERWLGVQVQGQPEQARVLLVSVPYAMKAAEADRLAGHSPSEFVTTETLQSAVQEQLQQQAPKGLATTAVSATGTSVSNGVSAPVTNPATNFVDTTTNQVVQVQQNGTGMALTASSPSNVGVLGTTSANAISGIVAGVEGVSSRQSAYGVYGRATSTAATGPSIGVYGQSDSPGGLGLSGWAAGTGNTIGLQGGASSTAGFAINATETATSGNTVGLVARILSPIGIPVLIFNNATSPVTGSLISARTLNGVQFSVGGTGNVVSQGTISGTRLISTVTTGTAPLQVASTTVVPNLNASLLGGSPASAFAMANAVVNSFNGRGGAVVPTSGDYSFPLLSGTLSSSQFGGSYSNAVTLSNAGNSFTGNGSGLTSVNASQLGGFGPGHFATNFGSPNYIQNNPGNPQNGNFNITGNGSMGTLSVQNGVQAFNFNQNNAAISAQDNNTTGFSEAIDGATQDPGGIAIHGQMQATSGVGIGVLGESKSTDGAGVIGVSDVTTGKNYGVVGYSASTSGYGVGGSSPGVAVAGITQTCTDLNTCTLTSGIAGQFETLTGGTLLQGKSGADLNSLTTVFGVDSSGNVTAAGVPTSTVTGVAVYVDSGGHFGVQTSSARFKEQILDMGDSTDGLMKLRPVTYFYKPEYDKGPRTLQYGLIAEEVAKVYPELVAYGDDGKPFTVKYQYLASMLLNEVQKQQHRAETEAEVIKAQQQEIDGLRQQLRVQNVAMQERLSRLESLVERQTQTAVNLPQK